MPSPRTATLPNLLFPCGRNRLRSPTAEQLFATHPGCETDSAGLDNNADTPCFPEQLAWADIVFVMEKRHKAKLTRRFAPHLRHTRIVCLDIPDSYAFMQPELVTLLNARVRPHLRYG